MNFPKYNSYKDSGIEWLGEVPAHWEIYPFQGLFEMSGEKNEKQIVGEMLSISGFRGVETKRYESESQKRTAEQLADYRVVRRGQLAVNTMWLNYAGLGVSDLEGHMSPAYRAYNISSKYNQRFAHHLLRSSLYVEAYTGLMQGIRPNSLQIKNEDFKKIPILLPPKFEQDRIVDFLDTKTAEIDALIQKKERQIQLLDEQKAIRINQAVTRGLNPKVTLKPSGIEWIGDIPEHWEVKPGLSYFIETDQRSTTGEEELLSVSHLTGVTPRSEKNINMFMAESYEGSKICEVGDIAVNTMWAWMAAIGVSKYHGLISPSYNTYCQKKPQVYLPEYLDILLRTNAYKGHYFVNSTGITTSRLRLYPHPFLRLKFVCPPKHEQEKIIEGCKETAELIKKSIVAVTKQIQSLKTLRSTLIAHAVTGKIKV